MEQVADFKARAEAWLAAHYTRRSPVTETPKVWGEGEFDVTVFHDRSEEEERRYLGLYTDYIDARHADGLWALTWAADRFGAGLSKAHQRAWIEVESRYETPNDHELISVTTKLVAPAVEKFGSPELREQFSLAFLTAKEFACQLFSEPQAGSDLAGLTCKAVRDGDEWLLEGQKVWTSNARIAPWGLAICRTDPTVPKHAGLTAFLVPLQSSGTTVRGIKQMNGGASFNEVFFDGTRIPDSLRVGEVGEGWKVAVTVLGFERESSGSSGRRGGQFDDLVLLARHMNRLDDPLIRQGLAKIYSAHKARMWARDRAAAKAKLGGSAGPEGSIGKLMWSNTMQDISAIATQLLGPALGADTGEWGMFDWNQHILGAPGYRIAGGSDEIQRNIIGERVLGLPGEPRVDRDIPFNRIGK